MDKLEKILQEFADKIRYNTPLFSGEKTDRLIKKEILKVKEKIGKLKEQK